MVCSFVATLVNPPAFVTIENTTITANAMQTNASNLGSHSISVLVKSVNYPTTVFKTYTFFVNVLNC